MQALNEFRQKLKSPEHRFQDTLDFIGQHYQYQPSAFVNGFVCNAAGENEGSCKTLGLAVLEGFSTEEALLAFGEHYRAVLEHPNAEDHRNIRALIQHGVAGIQFERQPLQRSAVHA